MQGEQLCREYFVDMKIYLENYKKEVAQGKKDGMVDDFDADEMTYELYRLLSGYFLKKATFACGLFKSLNGIVWRGPSM